MGGDIRPRIRFRIWRVLGLAVVAPLVAETVASSNTPAIQFPIVLPLLVLIYGLPALLIRELWMRGWIGWPGFLVLGAAYTALNEGVVAATWFKLEPDTQKVLVFTAEQAGRANGVNWAIVLNLIVYHTLWSMLIPIVLMEAFTRRGRARPWLPGWAMVLATAIVVVVVVGSLSPKGTESACQAPTQQIFEECIQGRRAAAVFIFLGAIVAILLPRPRLPRAAQGRRPPDAALVTLGILYSIGLLISYFILPLSGNARAAQVTAVLLLTVATVAIVRWSRSPTWNLFAATLLATAAMIPGMLGSIRSYAVLQPVAAAGFVLLFLLPALHRARVSDPEPEYLG